MSSVVGTFLYSSNSANKLCVSWELLEYKGTGNKHLTQTCEVLKAYDTELAENRDKKSYRVKKLICRINERPCAVNKCSNKRIQENIPRRVYKMIKKLSLE